MSFLRGLGSVAAKAGRGTGRAAKTVGKPVWRVAKPVLKPTLRLGVPAAAITGPTVMSGMYLADLSTQHGDQLDALAASSQFLEKSLLNDDLLLTGHIDTEELAKKQVGSVNPLNYTREEFVQRKINELKASERWGRDKPEDQIRNTTRDAIAEYERAEKCLGTQVLRYMPNHKTLERMQPYVNRMNRAYTWATSPFRRVYTSMLKSVGDPRIMNADGTEQKQKSVGDVINETSGNIHELFNKLNGVGDGLNKLVDNEKGPAAKVLNTADRVLGGLGGISKEMAAQLAGSSALTAGLAGSYYTYSRAQAKRQQQADRKRIREKRNLIAQKPTREEFRRRANEIDNAADEMEALKWHDYILPTASLLGGAGLGAFGYHALKNSDKTAAEKVAFPRILSKLFTRSPKVKPPRTFGQEMARDSIKWIGLPTGVVAAYSIPTAVSSYAKTEPGPATGALTQVVEGISRAATLPMGYENRVEMAKNYSKGVNNLANAFTAVDEQVVPTLNSAAKTTDTAAKTFDESAKIVHNMATTTNKSLGELMGIGTGATAGGLGILLGSAILDRKKAQRAREANKKRLEQEFSLETDRKLSDEEHELKAQEIAQEFAKNNKLNWKDYIMPSASVLGGAGLGYLGYKHFTNNFNPPTTSAK